ncbi:unnamed protein product, partial [Prorocentrum cordatum]
ALAKELASTKAKLAETTSKQHAPSMEVDEGAEHCEGQGDSLDQKRARLEEVDAALRAIAGSSEVLFETARVELEDTRKKLSAELAAAKPVPAQLRTLSFKLGKLEQKRAKQEEALQAAKDKVVQANKEADEATQQLAESDAAILELQQEQTRLAATLPRPPAGGVSPKADIVEGLGVTIEKLGAMLAELGDSGVLAEKLGAVLGEVREYEQRKVEAAAQEAKAAAEARATQAKAEPVPSQGAKESEAGPDLPDPDTATEEELREVRKITDALGGWREVKRAKASAARSMRRAQLLERVGAREQALTKARARRRRGKASSKVGLSAADRDVLLPRRAGQGPAAASGSQAACSAVGSVGLQVGNRTEALGSAAGDRSIAAGDRSEPPFGQTGRGDDEADRGGRLGGNDYGEVCSGIGSAGLPAGTTGGGDGKDDAWGRPFPFSHTGADEDGNHVPDRKGSIVTFNCSEEGQLLRFLDSCEHTVVAIQEHHVAEDRLPDLQHRALDPGWHGVWSSATKTGNQEGTQAGLAILAKGDALVT